MLSPADGNAPAEAGACGAAGPVVIFHLSSCSSSLEWW